MAYILTGIISFGFGYMVCYIVKRKEVAMNERLVRTVCGLEKAGVRLFPGEKKKKRGFQRIGSMICEVNRVSNK